jgi:hypothetical protein
VEISQQFRFPSKVILVFSKKKTRIEAIQGLSYFFSGEKTRIAGLSFQ